MTNPLWKSTQLFSFSGIRELRAAVAHAITGIAFRRHGLGLIQGYLREGTDHEVRVHIWQRAGARVRGGR